MNIQTLSKLTKIPEPNIWNAYPIGSHVYGTNTETSDEDYLVVSSVSQGKQDLVSASGINVIVHTLESWIKSLNQDISILSLECIFLPDQKKIKEDMKVGWIAKPKDIFQVASEKSLKDWKKAKTKFEQQETLQGKKKIFHSLRLLSFAEQLVLDHKITDYGSANGYWMDLYTDPRRSRLLESL